MRLVRGLWIIEARAADGSWFVTQPVEYDQAAVLALIQEARPLSRSLYKKGNDD